MPTLIFDKSLFVEAIGGSKFTGGQIMILVYRRAGEERRRMSFSVEQDDGGPATTDTYAIDDTVDVEPLARDLVAHLTAVLPAVHASGGPLTWHRYNLPGDQVGAALIRDGFPDAIVEFTRVASADRQEE